MTCFVDTSAMLAVLDQDDLNHVRAKRQWQELLNGDNELVGSNYVLVEVAALAQHRFGMEALRVLLEDIEPALTIEWITESVHRTAVSALLAAGKRKLSLVDCTSFELMRLRDLETAFAFDRHFRQQGFHCIP